MKTMKKMMALALAMVMVLAMGMTVFAQTDGTAAANKGSITINNAAKGETYKVTKIFDATVTGDEDGSIAYLGTIPAGLTDYFEYIKDSDNNNVVDPVSNKPYVKLKADVEEADLISALQDLYGDDTTGGVVSDGSALTFQGLDYGYYVVSTSQGEAAITVTSTNPNASVYDKNTTTPTASKTVDDADVYIGQTVEYTLAFDTTNYLSPENAAADGSDAKQVIKYEISDTLPSYLTSVTVTSIKVDADGDTETTNDQTTLTTQQFSNKKITIDWATGTKGNYTNLYNNGAKIIITYTAVVTAEANIGDADGNRNEVTLTPYVDNGGDNPEPWSETFKDDETIKSYGAAIHKVDENGNDLAGAKFKILGLTVSGSAGKYTVTNYKPTGDGAISMDDSTEMEVDSEGYIYILGLASDVTLPVTETKAPDGYNKLNADVTLTPIKMDETTSYTAKTIFYDPDGKVVYETVTGGSTKSVTANYEDLKEEANVLEVENQKGTELPSTGGIGTTIFYVIGAILVLGAGILLVTRRRMNAN